MSKRQNNIKAFFETNDSEIQVDSEISLYNGLSVEYDYNNSDITSNFSLAIDLTAL